MTTITEDGLGTFVQTVTIEVEVVVTTGATGNFNEVSTVDLRAAIEDEVRGRFVAYGPADMRFAATDVTARRGPGGSRYAFPASKYSTDSREPLRLVLDQMDVPTEPSVSEAEEA